MVLKVGDILTPTFCIPEVMKQNTVQFSACDMHICPITHPSVRLYDCHMGGDQQGRISPNRTYTEGP